MSLTSSERITNALAGGRIMRHADLKALGIPSIAIKRALEKGVIQKINDDLTDVCVGYSTAGCDIESRKMKMAQIAQRHHGSVLCLWSALYLHDLTDDMNEHFTAAVPPGANRHVNLSRARLVSWSKPDFFEVGVETVVLFGQQVRVTDPYRTLLDCMADKDFPVDDRIHAMRTLAREHGIATVQDRVFRYAVKLNIYARIESIFTTMSGTLYGLQDREINA